MDGLALAATDDLNTDPFALKEQALGMSVGEDARLVRERTGLRYWRCSSVARCSA